MKTVAAQRSGRTIRILIADDHRFVRCSLANVLSHFADLEVVAEAVDGEQILHAVEQHRPDVVLMDVSMPHVDGIEATRQIARSCPDVRVVGLSMHDDSSVAAKMHAAGAAAFIGKDEPIESLVAAIRGAAPRPRRP